MAAQLNSHTLTVVIPHYRHAHLLERAVGSALAQASQTCSVEVLVVDDGSRADDLAKVRQIVRNDKRIRLIEHGENRGVVAALNTGLGDVNTEFVSFLGADDAVLPGWADALVDLLTRFDGSAFACARAALVNGPGEVLGVRPFTAPTVGFLSPDDVVRELKSSDNWVLNTTAIHRFSIFKNIGGFDPSLGSFCDAYLVRRLAVLHGFCFHDGLFGIWTSANDTYSAATSHSVEKAVATAKKAKAALSASEIETAFPGYAALHDRRLRFSLARHHMHLHKRDALASDLTRITGLRVMDAMILRILLVVPRARLVWLYLRLRPLPISAMIRAGRANRRYMSHARRVVAQWFERL